MRFRLICCACGGQRPQTVPSLTLLKIFFLCTCIVSSIRLSRPLSTKLGTSFLSLGGLSPTVYPYAVQINDTSICNGYLWCHDNQTRLYGLLIYIIASLLINPLRKYRHAVQDLHLIGTITSLTRNYTCTQTYTQLQGASGHLWAAVIKFPSTEMSSSAPTSTPGALHLPGRGRCVELAAHHSPAIQSTSSFCMK